VPRLFAPRRQYSIAALLLIVPRLDHAAIFS
jgi:hypothetical protein